MECPHWERPTSDGRCIPKWWAGPPVTWFAVAGSGVVLGVVVALIKEGWLGDLLELDEPSRATGQRRLRNR
jgi:hypothetical protein